MKINKQYYLHCIFVGFISVFTTGCFSQKQEIIDLKNHSDDNSEYVIPGGKSSSTKSSLFANKTVLNNKETFSFEIDISKLTNNKTQCRGCNGYMGIEVSGCKFIFENNKKDLRLYAGHDKLVKLPYYPIDGFSENIKIKFLVRRFKDSLEWVVITKKRTIGKKIKLNGPNQLADRFIYKNVSGKELEYKVSNLFTGYSKLPEYEIANLHPLIEFIDTATDKKDWNEDAAKFLILENTKEKITDSELHGFEKYLLHYTLPTHNHLNYYFRKRFNSYMLEWMYNKTDNNALLIKAIEIAKRAVAYRNDNFGRYKISFDKSVAPVWPNYKEIEVYHDGSVGLVPGAAVFAGLSSITVPIRMIANNPAIWNKKYNEEHTFKELAEQLSKEALKTIDYTYATFVGKDNLITYPNTLQRKEWHNKLFIYNRVFPIITGAIPLAEALEKLELLPNKVNRIDQVNQAMIDRLKEDITFYKTKDYHCMSYPYSEAMRTKKPTSVEDFTHGAFDSRDFQLLFLSNRYNYSKNHVEAMANTLVEVAFKGDKGFAQFIDGSGKTKHFPSLISYIGYIWYASYRPEIYEIIIDYVINKKIVYQNNRFDSYFIFEMLKLKDIRNKTS